MIIPTFHYYQDFIDLLKPLLKKIWHLPRRLAVRLIEGYQKILSPDHSVWSRWVFPYGHCKYRPTCSEYAKIAFQKNGFVIGLLKTTWRLLRCNPWSKGGWDVP